MFISLLERNVREGIVNLTLPDGSRHRIGTAGVEADWLFHDRRAAEKIARNPLWQLGETYINGDWDAGDGGLYKLLYVLRANFQFRRSKYLLPFVYLLRQWNKVARSYRNVSHHYDLDEKFFRRFLDREMHYSCAYFPDPSVSLEQAQQAKCRLIAGKLLLAPGQRVLDIGCGWGSFAIYLAAHFDVEVVGITLSREQLAVARRRASTAGIKNVRFELEDYREHHGDYDRIVSIGMFEHVGKPYYQTYFDGVKQLLRDRGVALIHTIGSSSTPGVTNPWINRYIFPGGQIPTLSQVSEPIEGAGLLLTDLEVLRLHYAWTLREWHKRFSQQREAICAQLGERFCRMWEFYLLGCQVSFECADLVVFQLQLARQHGVVPNIRDYLYPMATEPELTGESKRGLG